MSKLLKVNSAKSVIKIENRKKQRIKSKQLLKNIANQFNGKDLPGWGWVD